MTERGDCQRLATGDSLADPKELLNSILLIRAKGKDDPCRTIIWPRLGVPAWGRQLDITDLYAFPKPGALASRS
jgi:hypothetical protein